MSNITSNDPPNLGSIGTDALVNGRRRRRWAPKVRTGCLTCKIRRVKCDETKPSCRKCTSTGRKCEGYEDQTLKAQPVVRSRRSNAAIAQPQSSEAGSLVSATTSVAPHSLSWLPFYGGELQKENFDYFLSVTSPALSSFYGSEFWARETLQVAHQYPALFHAITAFGSIHRSYLSDETPSDVPRDGTNNQIEFGLAEFNKAIKSMSTLITQKEFSVQDQQAILTTCVLFTGLSSLQGRQSQAFMHIKNGLRMLRHWRLNSRTITLEEKNAFDMLLLTFVRLDTQIRPYLVGQESVLQWTDEDIVATSSSRRTFRTMFEAYFDLEVLFNKLLRLNFNAYSFKELALEIESLRNEGQAWDRQFAHLLSTITPTASDLDVLDLIRLRRVYARAFISCLAFNAEGNVHDNLIPTYTEIIELSEKALQRDSYTVPGGQKFEHPIFVLGSTVIEPLFFIATRCREPTLRRRALFLLRCCLRREGICESMMAFKVSQRIMEVEEQFCPRFIDWHSTHAASASAPSYPLTMSHSQVLPIRPSSLVQNNNFRATSESISVFKGPPETSTSSLDFPPNPETKKEARDKDYETRSMQSQCSPKGKWVCEKHRVVETQFLLFTERQVKVVIWTMEDWGMKRKGSEMILTWW